MKLSHKPRRSRRLTAGLGCLLLVAGIALAARGDVPAWLQNVQSQTPAEHALFRSMPLPGGPVLAQRPPAEARPLLDRLVAEQPSSAELHSLRAMSEERQLDFAAAENDWKFYAAHAADRASGELALADFYHRRLRPQDEIHALSAVAQASAAPSESLVPPRQQQSWLAFERIFRITAANHFPAAVTDAQSRDWIARYPRQASLYATYFRFLLAQKDYGRAADLIASYRKVFPADTHFPVKARALLEYTRGNIDQGLAIYDGSFRPLWPQDLIDGYFGLLRETDTLRKFLDRSRAALAAHPDDINDLARVFYYYQQERKSDAALQVIDEFRRRKETGKTPWTGEQLYTLSQLLLRIHAYPEVARYLYALYSAPGGPDNRRRALTGLIRILLDSPGQSIRLGAGDLSLYKDIGSLDPGPGFLNGILSLLFNSAEPAREFSAEEQRSIPYSHAAEAARLLSLLDRQFPKASERPALHVRLLQVYVRYGESETVVRLGRRFLADFPDAPQRTQVSLLIADADARLDRPDDEFAIYDAVLRELGAETHGVPLGANATSPLRPWQGTTLGMDSDMYESDYQPDQGTAAPGASNPAFALAPAQAPRPAVAASAQYSRVLERYLARLASLHRIPQALTVLRREIDRNPNDPGLYERLARFLQQNQLGAQEEEVYRRAIAQFPTRSWYQRLARFYLRYKRDAEFAQLTRQVVQIFAGTDLQAYFQNAVGGVEPQLYLQLNLYAHRRFPHNLVFVRNLLGAYRNPHTYDVAAWEALLHQHWFEDAGLRAEYFQFLSRNGRLDARLASLSAANADIQAGQWQQAARSNPAAVDFYAEAELWRSHFEQGTPALGALAAEFPANFDIGRRASDLYRSLAYFHPRDTAAAVAIEKNLLRADPGNTDILARIGDIYGDRDLLAQAAPFWNRIADIRPGDRNSYISAATIFWDYYRFHDALLLLDLGRRRLGNPALFAYQEGAIYENQRDYPAAVREYVKGALASADSYSDARTRLLSLAGRPKLSSLVDRETANLTAAPNPPIDRIRLRLAVLDRLDKEPGQKKDAERALLLSLLDRTNSLTFAAQLESLARQYSLATVRQQALERQAALTTDPVHRLELRYELVKFFEGGKDYASAQENVEALYRENPKILGIVRATVDFYWQRKMRERAIYVLLAAAKSAYPALRDKFDYEAARKAAAAGNFSLARRLLTPLLAKKPYDGELLAAMANTFARAGDEAGLRDFYLAQIARFRNQPAVPAGTVSKLRRGLIPALTQLHDYTGAVDQYIEIINRYPEDAGLTSEAALYAQKHGIASRLTSFYERTVARSPRDVRWAVVLARLQTTLEEYPAAVSSYAKAIAVRPDRTELYIARADLLLRLMRFDAAAADYTKLFSLSFHDPQWMRKVAEIRARQGRVADAVAALRTAWIDGHSATPSNFFAVARALASWNLLPEAADFAAQGVRAAGAGLLADPANLPGARLYTRILTRLRRQQEAYAALQSALASATGSLPLSATIKQVEKQGLAAVTDAQWRERERRIRSSAGRNGMQACLEEMGQTVQSYFTPAEKQAFANFLQQKRQGAALADLESFFIPAARAAGLHDLQARWLYQAMLADPETSAGEMQQLISLQSQRLQFLPLAHALESFAPHVTYSRRRYILTQAADAYRSAGDDADELRLLIAMDQHGWVPSDDQRYFSLLLSHDRQALAALPRIGLDARRNAAAAFSVASGDASLAYSAIQARGFGLPPVWTGAYTGLVGLYYADRAPAVGQAFHSVLDEGTIGDRLGKKVDRNRQLAGDLWFYYASRYGEYLGVTRQGNPENYLPAVLEQSPGRTDAYLVTADYYAGAGDFPHTIADFRHALDLSPRRADLRDRLAVIYWKAGRRAQALDQWNRAFTLLQTEAKSDSPPESFWNDFSSITLHLRQRHLALRFRPQMDAVLRAYLQVSGAYRALPLLHSAFASLENPAAATAWLLDLAPAASSPDEFLSNLADAKWIPLPRREPIFQSILARQEAAVAAAQGEAKDMAQAALFKWQLRWLDYLIETHQFQRAQTTLDALPAGYSRQVADALAPIRLRLAAHRNTLDALLRTYQGSPENAPSFSVLRQAALALQRAGEKPAARKILDFAYAREIDNHDLSAANFLGLAEIRLQSGDLPSALALLNRLTLVVGQPFANLDSAAALLEKTGHPAQAANFLAQLVRATPWEPAYHLRLARARLAARQDVAQARKNLAALASDAAATYPLRADAASALAGAGALPDLRGDELNLLARGAPFSLSAANQPFCLQARLQAAGKLPAPAKIQLLRSAVADWPDNLPARIQLFQAAAAARNDRLALAAISPLLRTTPSYFPSPVSLRRLGPRFLGSSYRNPQQNSMSLFVSTSPAARLRLTTALASVMERLDRIDDAVRYLQSAVPLASTPARRAAIRRRIASLQATLSRRAANARRRPHIHRQLDQKELVHPRLLARGPGHQASPSASGGGLP